MNSYDMSEYAYDMRDSHMSYDHENSAEVRAAHLESEGLDEVGMDPGFYNHLDGFLSRPSPAIPGGSTGGPSAGKGQKASRKAKSKTAASSGTKAPLSSSARTTMTQPKVKAPKSNASSKNVGVKSRVMMDLNKSSSRLNKPLDSALLEEAFMYADWVASAEQQRQVQMELQREREDLEREMQHEQAPVRRRSEPEPVKRRVSSGGNTVYRSDQALPSSRVNVVRSLKSKSGGHAQNKRGGRPQHSSGFSVSAESTDNSLTAKSNRTDYDALLRNFTECVTLNRLRHELAESQASMDKSTQYIRDMASGAF